MWQTCPRVREAFVPEDLSGGSRVRRVLIACVVTAAAIAVALPAQAASAATVHEIISKYTLAAHFTAADVSAMKKISDYESHDHATTHSHGCWGLFQLSTGMVKGHPWSDPVWNTKRALSYVKSRYGTPRKAWAHIQHYHWY
jgi:hypothetical protein